MRKTRIIATAALKGGVAKTTTTVSVGCILSQKEYKVLLVDLDAQANMTSSLLEDFDDSASIYESLVKQTPLQPITISDTLDVVPSDLRLAAVDLEIGSQLARERYLANLLAPIKENYDFIILDCPPSLGLTTLNALTACTDILVPLVAEVLPFEGLKMIQWAVNMVKKSVNPNLNIIGVLITQAVNTKLCRMMEENIRRSLGDMVFKTKIRHNTTIAEAPAVHQDIVTYDRKSHGAEDYMAFTEELLTRINS